MKASEYFPSVINSIKEDLSKVQQKIALLRKHNVYNVDEYLIEEKKYLDELENL
ncbi:MAG: hypothetical protein RIR51_1619, partial [Bacteroidota bacterium]